MKTIFTLLFLVCGFVAFAQQQPTTVNFEFKKGAGDSLLHLTVKDTASHGVDFKYKDLIKHRADIVQSMTDFVKGRKAEIAQVDTLLAKFKQLHIKQ